MNHSDSAPLCKDSQGDAALRLHQAIERLYEVFADYPPNLEGCPCCVTEEMKDQLRPKPLRELTGDDLFEFYSNQLSTWSDEDGLRHFLPRMCELLATEKYSMLDLWGIAGNLQAGKWRKWPEGEQEAIEEYLVALWIFLLQEYPSPVLEINDAMMGIGIVFEDITLYLSILEEEESVSGALHLARFILAETDVLLEERPHYQKPHFAAWGWSDNELKAIEKIILWLLEPERLACLRKLRESPPLVPLDFDLEKAIQTLEILQEERERLNI